jgi:hypothetical protein
MDITCELHASSSSIIKSLTAVVENCVEPIYQIAEFKIEGLTKNVLNLYITKKRIYSEYT